MSLCIDSRYITGVYALGQWFNVEKGSVDVDAYEFTNWEEDDVSRFDSYHTDYQMGCLYKEPSAEDGPLAGCYRDDNPKARFAVPRGFHGFAFIDADSKERISFSLKEVRAFREDRK